LDAAVLLAHVLGVSRTWLYAHPTRTLKPAEIERFEGLLRRRMADEPVAYLVGYKPFFGLDITVDDRVLIPRPETEMLVERVLAAVARFVRGGERPVVADVGTGSGAIAVAVAVNAPEAQVYATDVSDGALAVAAQNVWRYGVGEQVTLLPGHLFQPVPVPAHVMVANLPYVASGDLTRLPPQVARYEPCLALDGGADGLDLYRRFFALLSEPVGRSKLRRNGQLYLEIGAAQGETVAALASATLPGADVLVEPDYSGLPRLVSVRLTG
jgi:release factor glutamine methyltransferase